MKGTDKFLIGIVVGVILLVGVVLTIALLRPDQSSYLFDDTPEGAAHNYLLALQLEEYERAYSYLSPALPGYPANLEAFKRDVRQNRWSFGVDDNDISLAIEAGNVNDDKARIVVRKTTFYPGDLFDSGQHSFTFDIALHRKDGAWKITSSESYWLPCWESISGCE